MQKVILTLCLIALFPLGAQADKRISYTKRVTIQYRDSLEACKQDFDMPSVHTLPTGVGQVTVDRCFHNGFDLIHSGTEKIGVCTKKITCKTSSSTYSGSSSHTYTVTIKIPRKKYYCRFKGAGAILGQTGDIYDSGDKIYFSGEEPKNFLAKDPGCKTILNNMSFPKEKYCKPTMGGF